MGNALDQLYGAELTPIESAMYSPAQMEQATQDTLGLPATVNHRPNPLDTSTNFVPHVPRPPDPATGGAPGLNQGFGWSTGLRQPRSMRTLFGGATLVRPTMGVHPADGPVGFSTRTDRLEAGVAALYDQWLPTQRTIQESFTKPQNAQSGNA